MQKIITADLVFNGETFLPHHAVISQWEKIIAVLPIVSLPAQSNILTHYHLIAPSFIDLQIYGARNKLFSVDPSEETLAAMHDHCSRSGTSRFLPTIATNESEVVRKAIDAVNNYRTAGGKGVHGLHLEGPWINPIKRGAHIESLIHSPTLEEVTELLKYGEGTISMITLAPEVCDPAIIELIKLNGIIISAGHSNASFDESMVAFDNGIHAVTHLFNGMSTLDHRNPGLSAAVMFHDSVMASIIVDGFHVNFQMVKLAQKMMPNRLFLITDSVTATNEGPYPHKAQGNKFVANGILSGSALTMLQAVKNCVKYAGIQLEEALRMASFYPAKVLGIEHRCGRIAIGYNASFVKLDKKLNMII